VLLRVYQYGFMGISRMMNKIMKKIIGRIVWISILKYRDIEGFVQWYVLGGKRCFSRYFSQMAASHKWCFIVGVNNSGTSLLQRILEKTGQVSTLPYEGQLYTTVLKRGIKRGYERVYSEYEDELIVDEGASIAAAPRLIFDWMRCLDLPIKDIIVEKTPHNALRMKWLQKVFPNSYFICLVRNGYAVAEGIRRKGNKSIERAARHWNQANKRMLEQIPSIDKCLVVKYEDLVDNGMETACHLANFLELDRELIKTALEKDYSFNSVQDETENKVVNMNSRSFSALSEEDRSIIASVAAEMLEHFSYTAEPDEH